jgi:hypothetical protein
LSAVISLHLIAGESLMSGERRCRRDEKSVHGANLSVVVVLLLTALGISVTLLSARHDQWTPAQLEMIP